MKKSAQNPIGFLCLFIGLFGLTSCEKSDLSSIKNNQSYTIQSEYTKTEYGINILYPETYSETSSYRTVYILDADDYFKEIANVIEETNREDIILIGIGYTGKSRRGMDYSYPKDNDFPSESGGAKEFINFINHELIPYVENELDISSSDKSLFGHSLGGYFALYLLFQQEQENPFKNIIAASPNFMWYNAYLFDIEQKYFDIQNKLNNNLYVTVGDLEGVSINLFNDAFKNKIIDRSYNGFTFNQERLENTSHRNSPITTFKKGLSIIF